LIQLISKYIILLYIHTFK